MTFLRLVHYSVFSLPILIAVTVVFMPIAAFALAALARRMKATPEQLVEEQLNARAREERMKEYAVEHP
ncbi:MAG TPA: hypothetical protein VJ777_26365, partial [Mycobacterium sp.]|nr:hypothetical protein [Mycobacterium sp.]